MYNRIKYRFPSPSVKSSFINRFNESLEFVNTINTIKPYWTPFSHPVSFSYHNELMQRYSYIIVSGSGTSDVNGTYYPIGMLNDSFVWENNQHMYLTREWIDNTIGWMFGNLQLCYYGQPTDSLFPPSNQWKCYSGKEPTPTIQCFLAGECHSTSKLRSSIQCTQKSLRWNDELLHSFL